MYSLFEENNVKVLGISADSTNSHKKFADKYSLPFTLLADPDRKVISAYKAKALGHTKRISYLVGPDGLVVKNYPKVDPAHHGEEILKDILALKKQQFAY
jgi:peroxiredoxin Q/BCP